MMIQCVKILYVRKLVESVLQAISKICGHSMIQPSKSNPIPDNYDVVMNQPNLGWLAMEESIDGIDQPSSKSLGGGKHLSHVRFQTEAVSSW